MLANELENWAWGLGDLPKAPDSLDLKAFEPFLGPDLSGVKYSKTFAQGRIRLEVVIAASTWNPSILDFNSPQDMERLYGTLRLENLTGKRRFEIGLENSKIWTGYRRANTFRHELMKAGLGALYDALERDRSAMAVTIRKAWGKPVAAHTGRLPEEGWEHLRRLMKQTLYTYLVASGEGKSLLSGNIR